MDHLSITYFVVILYYSHIKYYHWGKFGEEFKGISIFLIPYVYMQTYNNLNIKLFLRNIILISIYSKRRKENKEKETRT